MKKHRVRLSDEERAWLEAFGKGQQKVGEYNRAMALLRADESCGEGEGWLDEAIAQSAGKTVRWVELLREKACEKGIVQAVLSKVRSDKGIPRKLDGRVQAQITSIACSPAPEGQNKWSLSLIGERLVELEVVDSISREGVRKALKKINFNPTSDDAGVSHPRRMRRS